MAATGRTAPSKAYCQHASANFLACGRVFATASMSSHMSIRSFSARWWHQAFQASVATPPFNFCFSIRLYIMLRALFVVGSPSSLAPFCPSTRCHRPLSSLSTDNVGGECCYACSFILFPPFSVLSSPLSHLARRSAGSLNHA